ncbi:MAG: hypothetical protein HXM47_05275, partial [Pseudoleptotrichia goodfellowii]|nr:hypothetical protein [Pseudoleptotrichia goodfellowii]
GIKNDNIEKTDYKAVSGYYKIIGINDLSYFYRILSDIFDLDKMVSEENSYFYLKLENCLKKLFEYQEYEYENKLKLKKVIIYLLFLIYYDENGNKKEIDWIYFNDNIFDLKENELEDFSETLILEESEFFEKDKFLAFLKLKYCILKNRPEFYMYEIKENIKNEGILDLEDKEKRNIFKISNNINDLYEVFFEDSYEFGEGDPFVSFDLREHLKEKTELKLSFKNNILEIPYYTLPNYVLKINFKKEKKLKKISRKYAKYAPIYELLDNIEDKRISSTKVEELLFKESSITNRSKTFGDLKKVIEDINTVNKRKNE